MKSPFSWYIDDIINVYEILYLIECFWLNTTSTNPHKIENRKIKAVQFPGNYWKTTAKCDKENLCKRAT